MSEGEWWKEVKLMKKLVEDRKKYLIANYILIDMVGKLFKVDDTFPMSKKEQEPISLEAVHQLTHS